MKKYKLTEETKKIGETTLYRIEALKNFNDVKKGAFGGWIEKEDNLSHKDNCWVYGDADVFDNARVFGNAEVYDDAKVWGNVKVSGNAEIFGDAKVYGNARVYGDAWIYGNTWVCGNVVVYDNARVYGDAKVYGDAWICGNTIVYDNAEVCSNARVYDNAKISENMKLASSKCVTDLSKNIKENIRCQCNLLVIDNKVIAYKQVKKDLTSFHDNDFKYEIGKIAEVKDYDQSNKSCSKGLHFSNPNYWNGNVSLENSVFLMAEIKLEDIITVQEGKIRCKKAKILGKYELEKENK